MIVGHIHGQTLSINSNPIVSDTINYITAKFTFTDDWEGLSKYCHFSKGSTVYDILLVNDEIPRTAGLVLGTGTWNVYLHGNLVTGSTVVERITTTIATIKVAQSGTLNGEPFPTATPSAGEQWVAQAQAAATSASASKTAAKASADESKTQADKAETEANKAQASATSASQTLAQVVASGNTAVQNINTAKTESLSAISTAKDESLDALADKERGYEAALFTYVKTAQEYKNAASQSATNAGNYSVQASLSADNSRNSAIAAANSATQAAQSAATSGYVSFYVTSVGDLMYERTDNAQITFNINNSGELEVII